MVKVTDADFRALRGEVARRGGVLCMDGTLAWFNSKGLDFRALYYGGIPVEEFKKINNHYGNRLVELAEERTKRGEE